MKNLKKTLAVGALVLGIGATSVTAYAASTYNSPAEALAGLTGQDVDTVVSQKFDSGKTYGTLANEAGKLDEFKAETLEMKKAALQAKVEAGTMTQEQADSIIKAIEENQATCDGSGSGKIGQKMGAGFGMGQGQGKGQGQGLGRGLGNGAGQHGGGFGNGAGLNR